jgi:type IV pilus assembly protein PilB
MARKRIGEILIQAGLIDETGLRAALVQQRRYGGPLGRVLVDLRLLVEDDLVSALSRQLAIPTIDLDSIDIPQQVLDLVSEELAESHGVVPFAQPMKFLDIAMSDPTNQAVIDQLRVTTKLNVRPFWSGPKAIERAVARYYGRGGANSRSAIPARHTRDSLEVADNTNRGPMEVVSGFDLDHEQSTSGMPTRASGYSNPALAVPLTPTRSGFAAPVPESSLAALASLQDRVAALEGLVARDEEVIKKLMGLLIDKGVVSRDELIDRLK